MNTKIATIMSVYHGDNPRALAAALDSILGQQLSSNVESRVYLAIDGPVSEDIERVVEERLDQIYCIQRLEQNIGLAAALNTLIKQLSDEQFIFRMDSDDRSYPIRFQVQLDYLSRHPDIDILGTDIVEVDAVNGLRRQVSYCRGPNDALDKICRRVPVAHPTVCFRRHVIERVGGYHLTGTNEDISLWFRCVHEGFKFDNVHQPLYEFTINQNFWRRRSVRKAFSELKCYAAGTWKMYGVTWRYVYPLLRFMLRISPQWVSRVAYNSFIRR